MMRGRTIAGVVAALLLLASCGGDDEPEAKPTVKQSAPTEDTPPVTPTASEGSQRKPLEAFVSEWIDAWNRMQKTGSTHDFRSMVSPDCDSCNNFIERVDDIYSNGGWVRTEGSFVKGISGKKHAANGIAELLLTLDTKPTKFKSSSTAPAESLPGGIETLSVTVKRKKDSWVVLEYLRT